MRVLLSILKTTLLVLLAISFLFVFATTLTTTVVDHKLVKAGFYKNQLRDNNFYDRIYTDVMPQIKDIPSYYGGLSVSEAEQDQLMRQIIPSPWLQQQVESKLDSAVAWLRSDTEELDLSIDLRQIKRDASPIVLQFIRQKLDSLPQCGVRQVPDLSKLASGKFPNCLPGQPGSSQRQAIYEPYMPQVAANVNGVIAQAPDHLDLIEEAAIEWEHGDREAVLDRFDGTRSFIDWTVNRIGLIKEYLIMFGLLVLIGLINWGRLQAALRWVGGTMLFSALPLLVIGLVARFAGPVLVRDSMEEIKDVAASIVNLSTDLSVSALKDVSWTFIIPVIVITAIGLVIFMLSFYVGREEQFDSRNEW